MPNTAIHRTYGKLRLPTSGDLQRWAAMALYAWVCHSCKTTNPAGSEACGACGCPAVASVAEIEEAKTGVKQPPRLSRKEWHALRHAEISVLPFWKKPAAYALQAMRVVGAVFILSGIFDFSLIACLIGLGIVLVTEVLFSLLKGRPGI
ncbi:MAG: hypothetical protein LWW83_06180 [Azonexaceae bacterium]|nr:hypothetical protein [Azonexaceae bacterium]